ncbi:enoyl-ACP reductase FabI [Pacificibacter marinus]|uniref:Enoyl-[acyl-carrier-protein] reductase [NADH] n=1 Tax=Pacificibacter marinus TaxID=658057 RepID=A0A1Y5SVF1_9RHOB|nr:enoyl-ACP reductase FabI [Pacificibacter marinus]SEK84783.1 Enoyl-[acyl-carrier-protein] reductase [NADH] [Pacificibacter marinus]SLN49312.1 Enoyl-[acyl-carrier-protein] reductase [NADH] FabI [Pacificibacter marinus]
MLDSFLKGKRGLVVGIANEHSIAAGCAMALHAAGANLAVTYANERSKPFVAPVVAKLDAPIFLPLDVQVDGQLEAVFEAIDREWGQIDFIVHSIAYCPKDDLHGPVSECSKEGFAQAMDISVHSLIRMTRLAIPLMKNGGSILTMSYYGAEKVIDHYNIMGPVKSALEGTVRYLAAELGPKKIRVNAISPGPLQTRAGSGIDHFDDLIDTARKRAPEQSLVTIEDVGHMAVGLVSDLSCKVTGNIAFVDSGYHVRA